MLHIAICTNDLSNITSTNAIAESFFSKNPLVDASIVSYTSSTVCAKALLGNAPCDILIIETHMADLDGIDLVRDIRQRSQGPEIIFTSNDDSRGIEAFRLRAAHYLVRPFGQTELEQALSTALDRMALRPSRRIVLKTRKGSLTSIDVSEVNFVENSLHSQHVHLKNGEVFEARQTLSDVLAILNEASGDQFFSPYKGFIVNIENVFALNDDCIILQDKTNLPSTKQGIAFIEERWRGFLNT